MIGFWAGFILGLMTAMASLIALGGLLIYLAPFSPDERGGA